MKLSELKKLIRETLNEIEKETNRGCNCKALKMSCRLRGMGADCRTCTCYQLLAEKDLLLEVEEYADAYTAKQNCWMGNGDCLTDNGQAMECNQVYNTQTNTYSNNCGMAIQGGGTLTPNKNKNIPNIKNKNVYKRTNRRSR